jgi:hypothetical protein
VILFTVDLGKVYDFMKKFICGILVLILSIIGAALPAYAAEEEKIMLELKEGELYDYVVLPDGSAALYTLAKEFLTGDITLPTTIDGYTVTSFGTDFDTYDVISYNEETKYYISDVNNFTVPEGYTSFYGLYGYYVNNSLNLPSTLEILKLTSSAEINNINVSPENKNFTSVDGAVYSKDLTELISVPSKNWLYYMIPDSTKTIDTWAFDLVKPVFVYIPESITEIEVGYRFRELADFIITPDDSYASAVDYNYKNKVLSPVEFTLICIGIAVLLAGVVVLIVVLVKRAKKKKQAAKE